MKTYGYIKIMTERIDSDGGVINEMKLIVDGDANDLRRFTGKPLIIDLEVKN